MCIKEKVEIIRNMKVRGAKCINKRWELFRRCMHKSKFMLGVINTKNNAFFDEQQFNNLEVFEINEEPTYGQTRSGNNWRKNT